MWIEISVTLASAFAKGVVPALFTCVVQLAGTCYKALHLPRGINLIQPVLIQITKPVGIQHIKIAGINAAVRFYDILDPADPFLVAGFRHDPGCKADVVFKLTDIGLLS